MRHSPSPAGMDLIADDFVKGPISGLRAISRNLTDAEHAAFSEPRHALILNFLQRVGPRLLRMHHYCEISMAQAMDTPPPPHSVASPRDLPVRRSSYISVIMIRAPVAPTG